MGPGTVGCLRILELQLHGREAESCRERKGAVCRTVNSNCVNTLFVTMIPAADGGGRDFAAEQNVDAADDRFVCIVRLAAVVP